jgi:hypothetical protein
MQSVRRVGEVGADVGVSFGRKQGCSLKESNKHAFGAARAKQRAGRELH